MKIVKGREKRWGTCEKIKKIKEGLRKIVNEKRGKMKT
jgi:hypothetical protein